MKLKITHLIFETVIDLTFWLMFWYVWIWNKMDGFMADFGLCSDTEYINDITQAYLFACTLIVIQLAIDIPFSIYDTFVIEERHGFNKTTTGTFIKDEVKKIILLLIMFAIVIPLILWTI